MIDDLHSFHHSPAWKLYVEEKLGWSCLGMKGLMNVYNNKLEFRNYQSEIFSYILGHVV